MKNRLLAFFIVIAVWMPGMQVSAAELKINMIEEWQEEISEEQEDLVWNDDEKIDSEFGFNTIDYSARASLNRVNMKGIPEYGDCAIASLASIEAYWANSTSGKYDAIYSMFNGVYISSWAKAGYTSKGYSLQTLYDELVKGPVIIHRSDAARGHYSVVVAYEGDVNSLTTSGFKVMEVQRYNRTDGSYGYPPEWNNNYSNAVKIPLDVWGSYNSGSLNQICSRNTNENLSLFADAYSENVTETDATIKGTLNATYYVSECGVYVGTSTNSLKRIAEYPAANVRWLTYNLNKYYGTLQKGTTYYYQLFAVINGTEYKSSVQSFTTKGSNDTIPPTITGAYITNVTNCGYTVVCTVTDNVALNRVEFPTWKESDTSAGCTWYKGTQNGNVYTFTYTDGNREGNYLTHIYAFDDAGNSSSFAMPIVYIDRTAPVIEDIWIDDRTGNTYTVACSVMDNIGVTRMQFPTWTEANGEDDVDPSWLINPDIAAGVRNGNIFRFTVDMSVHNNETGLYITHAYVFDSAGNYSIRGISCEITGDLEKPQISNVRIVSQTGSSYTVACTVTDNMGIDRVQFPTWTDYNSGDDLVDSWHNNPIVSGQKNGNEYTYTVNMSEHNDESGLYHTHIYAYDIFGNWSYVPIKSEIYPLNSISINAVDKQMIIGEECDLTVIYNPSNTTEVKNVTWKSSDDSIVSVKNGRVTAKAKGSAVISAMVAGKKASCTINVTYDKPIWPNPPDDKWPFSDVAQIEKNWKYESVKYVYENEIMNGIAGTDLFAPDSQLNRAMFATVLYRMAGSPTVEYSNRFTDVGQGKYYTSPILWANDMGIVKGFSDGSYGVDTDITREQIAKMLYEYAYKQGYNVYTYASLKEFTDREKVSSWATEYMQWAVYTGMISGKPNGDGTFRLDPKGEATRAECAKMLMMFMEKYK